MRLRRLDLGCGAATPRGFLGLDRFILPGVHVVADLDAPSLPFAANSFDLIHAFHSLEHVEDLTAVMREICRIGRAGAQVVLTAPYFSTGLNFANPYHHQLFNEHTPRFWTDAPDSAVDREEWLQPPLGAQWGLSHSDHSDPGFDLRCVRMEFFYFAEYQGLSRRRQRAARRHQLDVCEQILYHLVVFKPPLTEDDVQIPPDKLYTPPRLEERRERATRLRGLRSWWPFSRR